MKQYKKLPKDDKLKRKQEAYLGTIRDNTIVRSADNNSDYTPDRQTSGTSNTYVPNPTGSRESSNRTYMSADDIRVKGNNAPNGRRPAGTTGYIDEDGNRWTSEEVYNEYKKNKDEQDAKDDALSIGRTLSHSADADLSREHRQLYDVPSSYRCGGKKKLKKVGGSLNEIGNGIYKAEGRSHEQGGIDLAGNINIEGGEVVSQSGNNIKVLSKEKIAGGTSPAKLVEANPSKEMINLAYANQEKTKKKLGYNDDGTRSDSSTGGDISAKREGFLGLTAGLIGIGGSLISGVANYVSAKKTKAPEEIDKLASPAKNYAITTQAPSINTSIERESQKQEVRSSRDRQNKWIDSETGSSAVKLARQQQTENAARNSINSIEGQAKNQERQLQNYRNSLVAENSRANANAIMSTNEANTSRQLQVDMYNNQVDAQNKQNKYNYQMQKQKNISGALASIGNTVASGASWYAGYQNQQQYQNKTLDTILATDTNNSSLPMIQAGSFDNYIKDANSVQSAITAAEYKGNVALADALRERYKQLTGKTI